VCFSLEERDQKKNTKVNPNPKNVVFLHLLLLRLFLLLLSLHVSRIPLKLKHLRALLAFFGIAVHLLLRCFFLCFCVFFLPLTDCLSFLLFLFISVSVSLCFFWGGRGKGTSENGLLCVTMMMSSCGLVVFFVVLGIGAAAAG
jgi:hypothetical protein